MAVTVVLAGGGTGGHVFPALALAETIRKLEPQVRVCFLGAEGGLESRLVPGAGYPLDVVPARPVAGRGPWRALCALAALARGTWQARALLRSRGADLVIGVGGYASVPAVAAAATLRVPVALIEPNARPGRANRLLARLARAVFVQFEESEAYFPMGKTRRLGIPVREIPPRRERTDAAVRLLILGGSQGAHSINRAVLGSLQDIATAELRITHQTGERDLEEVRRTYERARIPAEVGSFFHDLPERLSAADLVVARSGAATVSELCAAGTPSILVPYPFAADDHQMANARALEHAGAAIVVPDSDAARALAGEIRALVGDPERRRRMGEAARRHASPEAARRIWEACALWLEPPSPGEGGPRP